MRSVLSTAFLLVLAATFLPPAKVQAQHPFNGTWSGPNNSRIAFPIGGMGAGMFCLEGTGAVSHMSIMHTPDLFNEPLMFAAISIKEMPNSARVLEGPVPGWKRFGGPGSGGGQGGTSYGLARFATASFQSRFPFGKVKIKDPAIPLEVAITGWSPFIPTDADNSSLPVGALEYHFRNTGHTTLHYIFSYNARNFLVGEGRSIKPMDHGFILSQFPDPQKQAAFAIFTDEPATKLDYCWFRGSWWDPLTMAWDKIERDDLSEVAPVEKDAPGASLYIPFTLRPGQEKTIRLMTAWWVPNSGLRTGVPVNKPSDSTTRDASVDLPSKYYKPWYSSRFHSIDEVTAFWRDHYDTLRKATTAFTDAFYRSTLPPEILEAISANLSILKSPTIMRQYDGRFWGWEGSNDNTGSCAGSCTHVYNYQQAIANLFPALERSMRETELRESMDANGHQNYRAALPIRPAGHNYYLPAADGQLGAIMRLYRDWHISGDTQWLKTLYPKLRLSMDYCIATWDPRHTGTLEEPHHNTYDIEFWGADPMCTSIYLGALGAFITMGESLHEDIGAYRPILAAGRRYMNDSLFNGEYFAQHIRWTGLNAADPLTETTDKENDTEYSPEAQRLLEKEGPKYQYGNGCLSDGVIGAWEARICGLDLPIDLKKFNSHLLAVYKYNYKPVLSTFSNPQRPAFAMGDEGGLLLCTWPRGGKLSLPFVYSHEVWTGVEYEVASALIMTSHLREGLDIIRTTRRRYDGRTRNPFDEYEAGHWYARALSSYALLQACTGVRYDALNKTLYIDSRVGDFTSFLSTATGFGNVIFKNGKASVKIVYGKINIEHTVITQ